MHSQIASGRAKFLCQLRLPGNNNKTTLHSPLSLVDPGATRLRHPSRMDDDNLDKKSRQFSLLWNGEGSPRKVEETVGVTFYAPDPMKGISTEKGGIVRVVFFRKRNAQKNLQ